MDAAIPEFSAASHRVLVGIADDAYARLVRRTLKEAGYDAFVALDSETFMAAIEPNRYDLAIVDAALDPVDGTSLIERLRREPDVAGLYVISVVSADERIQTGGDGPDDFVLKPFDANDLLASVRLGSRVIGLERDLALAQDNLETLALLDPLTGLPNQRALHDILTREIARQHRDSPPTCLALLKVTGMSRITGVYGEVAKELAALRVARTVHSTSRDADTIARLGEDEFVVLLYDCDAGNSDIACERLCDAVSHEPVALGDKEYELAITCGVVQLEHESSPKEALEAARAALYVATARGVQHVSLATRDLGDAYL